MSMGIHTDSKPSELIAQQTKAFLKKHTITICETGQSAMVNGMSYKHTQTTTKARNNAIAQSRRANKGKKR